MSVPTAEEQIGFLQQVQRLFNEGEFQATYKYALLLSMAELAVELGDDSGKALDLPMPRLAEKFAELYWRQVAPYQSGLAGTKAQIISQNLGAQAAVIGRLQPIHRDCGGRFSRAPFHPDWKRTLGDLSSLIRTMPLRYLQMLGGALVPFLYEFPAPPRKVVLKPGVAFNLRRYQALIQQFARAGWIDHVRGNSRNMRMLGQLDDLESFMFGSRRTCLAQIAPILEDIQSGHCFYCQQKLRGSAEVDHFIPWARYPRDTAHNFVLAHRGCNNDKRDMLAAKSHLMNWLARNKDIGGALGRRIGEIGFVADIGSSTLVARWAYGQAVAVNAQVWAGIGSAEPVTPGYLDTFAVTCEA